MNFAFLLKFAANWSHEKANTAAFGLSLAIAVAIITLLDVNGFLTPVAEYCMAHKMDFFTLRDAAVVFMATGLNSLLTKYLSPKQKKLLDKKAEDLANILPVAEPDYDIKPNAGSRTGKR